MKPQAQRVQWSRQVLGCKSPASNARDSPLPRVIPLPRIAHACRPPPPRRTALGAGTQLLLAGLPGTLRRLGIAGVPPAARTAPRSADQSANPPTHPRRGPQRGRSAVRPFLVREVEEGMGVSQLLFLARSKLACVAFPLATKSLR